MTKWGTERYRNLVRRDLAAAAWVLDRADQIPNASGARAVLDEIMQGLADGEHGAALKHGELDDLMKAPFIVLAGKRRTGTLE